MLSPCFEHDGFYYFNCVYDTLAFVETVGNMAYEHLSHSALLHIGTYCHFL